MAINRREWVLQVIQAGSLFAAAPASQLGAPIDAPAEAWKPSFFSREQNEAILALGERIVPGSTEALCNRVIDSVLALDSERNQSQLLAAIAAFDREAQTRNARAFWRLTAQQQDEILSAASQRDATLWNEVELVKEWVADAYWSSLKGRRELGSTGRMAWETFPGCPEHSSH